MRREEKSIEDLHLVFFAPMTRNLIDVKSGNSPQVTGTMSTFDESKGLYFNGNSGLAWNFSQLAFNPTLLNFDSSFTILCDYNRTQRSGHDWFIVIGTDSNKRLIGFLYDYNQNNITCALSNKEYPGRNTQTNQHTSLNTQYNNCGLWYDGANRTVNKIINGSIVYTAASSSFPSLISSYKLYIGQSSYSGDKMNGYLRNVRVYLNDFNEEMLL